jgi:hypothetical protein
MGKPQDMKQRETKARVDDNNRMRKVNTAREIIYKKNYAVDSEPVETLLKEQSLVPTPVSDRALFATAGANHPYHRTRSLASFLH